jgi:hypothetical protein
MNKYVYRNESGRPINIGGYQFQKDGEIASNIIIERFKEAVSNDFLSLKEVKASEKLKAPLVANPEVEAARKTEEARLAEEAKRAERAERKAQKAADAEALKKAEEEAHIAEETVQKAVEA